MSLLVATLLIGLLTLGVAIRVRGKKAPAPAVAIIYGLLVVGGMAATAAYVRIQDQRVRDQCVYNVGRSDGNRAQWLDLADYLTDEGVAPDAVQFIQQRLDVNLPQRDITECE